MSPSPVPVRLAAPAKLNLGLRVLGRRPDGFHELDSMFVRLELADVVTLSVAAPADDDRLDRAAAGDPWLDARPLAMGSDNLVLRAIAAYRAAARAHGVTLPPLTAELVKRIPWGAGLAGGSADAAATLWAAAALCPAGVDLAPLAAALGSDVPFCLADVAAARVRGRGERVVPRPLPPLDLVLVYPGVEVPTGPAFAWWAAEGGDVPPPDEAGLLAYGRGSTPVLANALEGPVAARVPPVAAALAALRALSLGPVAMSGSGSTCFALAPDADVARAGAAALTARHPDWWVRSTRSG